MQHPAYWSTNYHIRLQHCIYLTFDMLASKNERNVMVAET
jgi:hypothetical protein